MANRKSIVLLPLLFFFMQSFAQQPVEWSFYTKKIKDGKYEIHLSATIDKGWGLVSRFSAADNVFEPAVIKLQPLKNVRFSKEHAEQGILLKKRDAIRNISIKYFESNADFIITASSSATQKESLQGTISYVAFNGTKVLPTFTVSFSVPINNDPETQ
ncbi:MAG: hypothetical protein QM768_18875 [Agriterribacter sp.]